MTDRYSYAQSQAINRAVRLDPTIGLDFADELNALWALIDAGNVGITANAKDVDAIALGGGAISHDPDTTSGLTLGFTAGRINFNATPVSVSAGTVVLSSSSTNYVEADAVGVVSSNTGGFTTGSCPLWIIVTGVSSISTFTQRRTLMTVITAGGITGTQLSTAGKTKTTVVVVGTLSATGEVKVPLPNVAGVVTDIRVAVDTTIAASDTNYWQFSAVNKGAAGTGTTDVLSTAAANSTKVTNGSAVTAYVARSLTLHGTGANLITAAKDILVFTATKTASASNLVNFVVAVDITHTA